jgi:lysophospholipase L1-like esterase
MKLLTEINNIPFIDNWNLMNQGSWAANSSLGLMTDPYHPNAAGYALRAAWTAAAVNALV